MAEPGDVQQSRVRPRRAAMQGVDEVAQRAEPGYQHDRWFARIAAASAQASHSAPVHIVPLDLMGGHFVVVLLSARCSLHIAPGCPSRYTRNTIPRPE